MWGETNISNITGPSDSEGSQNPNLNLISIQMHSKPERDTVCLAFGTLCLLLGPQDLALGNRCLAM